MQAPAISAIHAASASPEAPKNLAKSSAEEPLREAFQDFVAGTFYTQMMKAMRSSVGKPAYMHGGRAEEIFQAQMDQIVAADLSKSHGSQFSDRMFEQFKSRL